MTPRRSARRTFLAVLLTACLLGVTGACGKDAQTLQPYTPAEGINYDVGNPAISEEVIHVRNLLLVSSTPGEAVISGALMTYGQDRLVQISGVPIKVDATDGAPFTAGIGDGIAIADGNQVLLTASPITVRSPDILAGLTVRITLTFATAGTAPTVVVPVADGNQPEYADITPTPAITPSA